MPPTAHWWALFVMPVALLAQAVDYQADGIKALDAKRYDAAVDLFTVPGN